MEAPLNERTRTVELTEEETTILVQLLNARVMELVKTVPPLEDFAPPESALMKKLLGFRGEGTPTVRASTVPRSQAVIGFALALSDTLPFLEKY